MNCKEGDLAVVVYCDTRENIGLLVGVQSLYGLDPDFPERGPCWRCQSAGSPVTCSTGVGSFRRLLQSSKFICPDAWLRPIRPGELDEVDVNELALTE